ncbi:MAG TPA: S46 family peptidase, partial [Burkholderiaceae bacterium]
LLTTARTAYRLANETAKPDAERKGGYQQRDLPRLRSSVAALDRSYDETIDKALVTHFLVKYMAQPAEGHNPAFDAALGLKAGMSAADIKAAVDTMYAGSKLAEKAARDKLIGMSVADFKASNDSFIKAAVAMYDATLRREAADEEMAGMVQQAYSGYMKAYIAYMNSKGRAVYPDANSTLRITFGKVASRATGADGTAWKAFTTLNGITAKATGTGEFNAPQTQLAAIRAGNYGKYAVPALKSVPVNFLATLDTTGGSSGSATMNSKGELIGLSFDGTLDAIISDWDFNDANTRTIQVDTRYMLWQMEVDKAHNLMREMGVL